MGIEQPLTSLLPIGTAAPAKAPAPTTDVAAARRAAEEFEAVFLSQMLGHMFAGVDTNGPFGGGHAEGVYRSMMINEYGQMISKSGGIGLADQVMSEILRIQETQT